MSARWHEQSQWHELHKQWLADLGRFPKAKPWQIDYVHEWRYRAKPDQRLDDRSGPRDLLHYLLNAVTLDGWVHVWFDAALTMLQRDRAALPAPWRKADLFELRRLYQWHHAVTGVYPCFVDTYRTLESLEFRGDAAIDHSWTATVEHVALQWARVTMAECHAVLIWFPISLGAEIVCSGCKGYEFRLFQGAGVGQFFLCCVACEQAVSLSVPPVHLSLQKVGRP